MLFSLFRLNLVWIMSSHFNCEPNFVKSFDARLHFSCTYIFFSKIFFLSINGLPLIFSSLNLKFRIWNVHKVLYIGSTLINVACDAEEYNDLLQEYYWLLAFAFWANIVDTFWLMISTENIIDSRQCIFDFNEGLQVTASIGQSKTFCVQPYNSFVEWGLGPIKV